METIFSRFKKKKIADVSLCCTSLKLKTFSEKLHRTRLILAFFRLSIPFSAISVDNLYYDIKKTRSSVNNRYRSTLTETQYLRISLLLDIY